MEFDSILTETPIFASLGDEALKELSSLAEAQQLRSGEALYEEGERPTHFYLVASGRLRVSAQEALVGYVGRSEPVGESLIRALEELGIPVDVTGGTSMGAFISAMLASGLDSVEMAQLVRETFVRANYLNDYAVPRVSLIRGRKFAARLAEIFGDRQIEDLRRTYFCVSTNLTTGVGVVHDRGPLAMWVGTSMAVPGVAPPIAYEGDLLCDGGVVDNLPTDVMQKLERGSIIACNVGAEGSLDAPGAGLGGPDPEALLRWQGADNPPRLSEILLRTAMLNSATAVARAAERADVHLHLPTQGFGMFEWRRLDELIELGHEHALEQLAPLTETLVR